MSLIDRLDLLGEASEQAFKKLGYKDWFYVDRSEGRNEIKRNLFGEHTPGGGWVWSPINRSPILNLVTFRVQESSTLKILRGVNIRFLGSWLPLISTNFHNIDVMVEHHVLCGMSKLPVQRITSAMPTLRWNPSLSSFATSIRLNKGFAGQEIFRDIYVHFLTGIQSLPEFKEDLTRISQVIVNNQNPSQTTAS